MKEMIIGNLFFGLIISYFSFEIGKWIFKKTQTPLCNPFLTIFSKKPLISISGSSLLGTSIVIFILKFFDISIDDYYKGAGIILFLLSSATVSLAMPLYKKWNSFKKFFILVMSGAVVGSFVGILSVIILGKLFGMDNQLIMPKSITTPFGIEVISMLGGIPAITVVGIMLTGITRNVTAFLISKIFKIKHSVAVGIGIGVSSHEVGTSKAMQIGEVEGSMSALSIVFAGSLTLVWASLLKILV